MPLYKFTQSDIFHNRIKAHPQNNFFFYRGKAYHNNRPTLSGSFVYETPITGGHVSLYELNVDRQSGSSPDPRAGDIIYPFIIKGPGADSSYLDFRRTTLVTETGGDTGPIAMHRIEAASPGDIVSGSYPMSASIVKEYLAADHVLRSSERITRAIDVASPEAPLAVEIAAGDVADSPAIRPNDVDNLSLYGVSAKTALGSKIAALKNTLDSYIHMSHHYAYSSASIVLSGTSPYSGQSDHIINWHKAEQEMGLVSIPSIFYGREIEKGTVSLKFYVTGALVGELRDERKNGELIQVGPTGSVHSSSVAGVVLYNEGFMLLTGSWDLTANPVAAAATLEFDSLPSNNDTVTLSDGNGNTVVFKFDTSSSDIGGGQLHSDNDSILVGIDGVTPSTAASRFRNAVNNVNEASSNNKTLNITATGGGSDITLTQDTLGIVGNTELIINSSAITGPTPRSRFANGVDGALGGTHTEKYIGNTATSPRWIDFAQTIATGSTVEVVNSSFELGFKGTNYVPTITMLAHARKGHLNYSNNPTYIQHSQNLDPIASETKFREQPSTKVKNTVSSSYQDFTASFKRQTYISKIGIYDEKRNLIGIAKVATPVKKTEDRDFTFKLKLDF